MKKFLLIFLVSFYTFTNLFAFDEKDYIAIYESFGPGVFLQVGHPVLNHLDKNNAVITWFTSSMGSGLIEYGTTKELGNIARHEIDGLYSTSSALHRAFLYELEPGTKYYYRTKTVRTKSEYLALGREITSPIYSFTTPAEDEESIKIAIVSDTHNQPLIVSKLAKMAKENDADMFVFNGDTVDHTLSAKLIVDCVYKPLGKLSAEIPILFVRGNHEPRGKAAIELRNLIYTPENGYYSMFQRAGSSFLVLDGGEDKPDGNVEYKGLVNFEPYRQRQTEWLAGVLETPAWKNSNFKIVINHIPIWYHESEIIYMKSKDWQHNWLKMLEEANTDIVFAAHTHRYEKRLPGLESGHDFYQIISGARPNKNTLTLAEINQTEIKIKVITTDRKIIDEFSIQKQ